MSHYLAIDLGATSGRTILGSLSADGKLSLEELTRSQQHSAPGRKMLLGYIPPL